MNIADAQSLWRRPAVGLLLGAAAMLIAPTAPAQSHRLPAGGAGGGANYSKLVFPGPDGKLQYTPDAQGNTIPDFSNCGYGGGGMRIPDVAAKATVEPGQGDGGDDTQRIQEAIDRVAKLAPDDHGIRGAVLLKRGRYRIAGQLHILAGGVILRGEGDGEDGTVLVAVGNTQRDLIDVKGSAHPTANEHAGRRIAITDPYVPVGARSFRVQDPSGLKVGDTVLVTRVGNAAWIHFIKMDQITPRPVPPGRDPGTKQWQPFDLRFDRVITAIDGSEVTVDAPITCAIDQKWGGGSIERYDDVGRVEQVGIEQLRGESEYDPKITREEHGQTYPADEDHAMYLVSFGDAKNCWARNLTTVHFYHGPAALREGSKWITVQDCAALEPVSIITGGRRYAYLMVGQLNLVQRCRSDKARHAFVFQARVCGPNAFLDCVSTHDFATSEPHHRWSVGGLYDNVHAHMAFQDRQWMGSGHGWAGANYVAWNCQGTLVCQQPPTAQNWAIGFVGTKEPGAFPGRPDGYWESLGKHVQPRSLYLKQLEDRLGRGAVENIRVHSSSAGARRNQARERLSGAALFAMVEHTFVKSS